MVKRILKTLVFGVAMTAAVAVSATFAGCKIETNHPEVKITVEFNSNSYEIGYKLYRNMYPQTVKHFIELADSGFYNDMIVHNYNSTDWFTGGYGYDEEAYSAAASNSANNSMGDYLSDEDICKEDEYDSLFENGALTASVFKTQDLSTALKTLIGEYSNNINQVIENGALSAAKGTLKMFYYAKETKQQVYVTPNSTQIITANYKNNCATSLFMMQVGSGSTYSASNYCTFATIKDSDALDDLLDAIQDYIDDVYDSVSSDFVTSATVLVDNNEEFSTSSITDQAISQTFSVPVTPIIIRSVKVTKY